MFYSSRVSFEKSMFQNVHWIQCQPIISDTRVYVGTVMIKGSGDEQRLGGPKSKSYIHVIEGI